MGIVYFLQAIPDGNIKIGHTKDLASRLSAIRSSSPVPLLLLFSFQGSRQDEMRLHKLFFGHRLHGEWYIPHQDIKRYVCNRLRARKAWVTRKRRNAALKAWNTRRAKRT